MEDKEIKIIDESGDKQMLWETIGKPAYEKGLLEGRQESGLFAIIPMSILENKTLSANAKLLYGEIMALSKKSGLCYATNEYMGEMLGLAKRSIPQILKELLGCGLILVDIERSYKGTYRNITVSFFNEGGDNKLTRGGIVRQRGQKRNRQREIDKEIPTSNASVADINKLIELFKPINPSYERLFSNKTQRAAIERLVKKYGEEKTISTIEALPDIINKPYAPKITTPYELERDLGKLIAFFNQEKGRSNRVIKV